MAAVVPLLLGTTGCVLTLSLPEAGDGLGYTCRNVFLMLLRLIPFPLVPNYRFIRFEGHSKMTLKVIAK